MALSSPKDISSANPDDICRFLVWKGKSGKSQVHSAGCSFLGKKGIFRCGCPSRLSYRTVDLILASYERYFKMPLATLIGTAAFSVAIQPRLKKFVMTLRLLCTFRGV